MRKKTSATVFQALTTDDEGRVCKDIPENACNHQPKNFITHVVSLSLAKLADELINPKLILSWVLTVLGAPAFFLGLLVPLREAGALLPQLFIAGYVRTFALRKYVWVIGSVVQGACAVGMGLAAFYLEGLHAGIAIITLLAVLALARSVCSVSYKDVLGKTVDKSNRGTATGTAASLAAALAIVYAFIVTVDVIDKFTLVASGLVFAGLFWFVAALCFAQLAEDKGATQGGLNPIHVVKQNLSYLFEDPQLRLFIVTRGLLMATALAPPFMVAIAAKDFKQGFAGLGWLLLASSLAGLFSGYIWGRFSDRSSRKVLLCSGFLAALALLVTVVCAYFDLLSIPWVMPTLLFVLMVAYQGVRIGRTTHLVDMATADNRAVYTALSNTALGILLFAGGGFSLIAGFYGELVVIGIFSMMCVAAMISAYRLKEVQ